VGLLLPFYPFIILIIVMLIIFAFIDLVIKIKYYIRIEKKLDDILTSIYGPNHLIK